MDQRLLVDWRLELDLRQSRRLEKAVKVSAECQHNNGNNDGQGYAGLRGGWMGHVLVRLQADHGASRQCGVNHCGGDRGVVSEDDVKSGKVQILSPIEFMKDPGLSVSRQSVQKVSSQGWQWGAGPVPLVPLV
jgi:hypothetical protein